MPMRSSARPRNILLRQLRVLWRHNATLWRHRLCPLSQDHIEVNLCGTQRLWFYFEMKNWNLFNKKIIWKRRKNICYNTENEKRKNEGDLLLEAEHLGMWRQYLIRLPSKAKHSDGMWIHWLNGMDTSTIIHLDVTRPCDLHNLQIICLI